jgi:hypothetical protein
MQDYPGASDFPLFALRISLPSPTMVLRYGRDHPSADGFRALEESIVLAQSISPWWAMTEPQPLAASVRLGELIMQPNHAPKDFAALYHELADLLYPSFRQTTCVFRPYHNQPENQLRDTLHDDNGLPNGSCVGRTQSPQRSISSIRNRYRPYHFNHTTLNGTQSNMRSELIVGMKLTPSTLFWLGCRSA